MHKPVEIDIITGKIKINIDYFENKYLYQNLYQRHFFNFLLKGKYKTKTNININEKNGQLLPSKVLIYTPETKELMEIEIKEVKGKFRINPMMKKATNITVGFINKNTRVTAIAFTIVYKILIEIAKKEILPEKKAIYEQLAEETKRLKDKFN